jgi:hypothetical protein
MPITPKTGSLFHAETHYLDLVATHACCILFEKAAPAGRLKREFISLATHDGRPLCLSTPQGFSASPFQVPREIFDHCVANKFIEQDGPEYPDGRILFRLTQAGRSRVDLARNVSAMIVTTYRD